MSVYRMDVEEARWENPQWSYPVERRPWYEDTPWYNLPGTQYEDAYAAIDAKKLQQKHLTGYRSAVDHGVMLGPVNPRYDPAAAEADDTLDDDIDGWIATVELEKAAAETRSVYKAPNHRKSRRSRRNRNRLPARRGR